MKRTRAWMVPIAALLATAPGPARGDRCIFPEKVGVWPRLAGEIPPTPRIELQGVGHEACARVRSIERSEPMMVAEGDRVPMKVVETYEGKAIVAAVLVPVRPLIPGYTYKLEVTSDQLDAGPGWKVVAAQPEVGLPLRWIRPPRVEGTVARQIGLRSARYLRVSTPVEGGFGPVAFLATLRNLDREESPQRFLLTARDGIVMVGHSTCYGEFKLRPGVRYSLLLEAIDLAGNRAVALGGALEVHGPKTEFDDRKIGQ